MLTISHHLQKSLDAGRESYIVQLYFGAAFDRVSYRGLLFKLKSIGVDGSVVTICAEFVFDRRQRFVVDGAASECMDPNNFSRVTGKCVGFCSVYPVYQRNVWLVENRLIAYADDSTLLAVVRKPGDWPAVAASLNRELARIQEWCNHWFMILNPNKTKVLVVSRSRTMSPFHGDLVLSGVSIRASPNLDILGVKFINKLIFEYHMRGIVSSVSQRIGILRLVKCICGHLCVTSMLFCICSPNPWLLFSGVGVSCWMSPSASWAPGVFSCQALSDQSFLWLCHRRGVAGLSMLCKVNFELESLSVQRASLSASTRVRHTELRPQLINWSLQYQCVGRPNLQGLSCRLRFECGMTFHILCLTSECWMGSRVQSTVGCFLSCVFFFRGAVACGQVK